jgi:hypothetical protein
MSDTVTERFPELVVLTDDEVCRLAGFSRDTLIRLDAAGDGPPKVRISDRRHGRPYLGFKGWLEARRVPAS